ncbi:hypothetical protein PMAYCL1PPCAC_23735, partial [Pristionchus mayeri]
RVRKRLILYATFSRIAVFALQLIFSSFDFSTDAFKGVQETETWIGRLFRGFVRWDALQFVHVAEYGYVFEHSLAFFPCFPTVIHAISNLINGLSMGLICTHSSLLITALLINFVAFLFSTLLVYKISLILTSSTKISLISALLFSINPASIFFSSIYTESLYCTLSLLGIYILLSSRSSNSALLFAALIFAGSFLTRSNGILNIGYILFYGLLHLLGPRGNRIWDRSIFVQLREIGYRILAIGSAIIFIVFALRIHSIRQTDRFCSESLHNLSQSILDLGRRANLSILGTPVPWCSQSSLIYPPFYTSIQRRYWDVNLFGYWTMHKMPCFLLAAPALFFTFYSTIRVLNRLRINGMEWGLDSHGDSLPFALHSVALALPALLVYNVEVFTRIVFSSSPFLYIELARVIHERTRQVQIEHLIEPRLFPFLPFLLYRRDICCAISAYFFLYFSLGTAMHASFLPFT